MAEIRAEGVSCRAAGRSGWGHAYPGQRGANKGSRGEEKASIKGDSKAVGDGDGPEIRRGSGGRH